MLSRWTEGTTSIIMTRAYERLLVSSDRIIVLAIFPSQSARVEGSLNINIKRERAKFETVTKVGYAEDELRRVTWELKVWKVRRAGVVVRRSPRMNMISASSARIDSCHNYNFAPGGSTPYQLQQMLQLTSCSDHDSRGSMFFCTERARISCQSDMATSFSRCG